MEYRIVLSLLLATLFASIAAAGNTPINDLGTGLYLSTFQGGLYPGGSNVVPSDHAAAGATFNNAIVPLDVNGNPSLNGKYVLLSIGMSNTAQEFCCVSGNGISAPANTWSFMGQAAADPQVNKTSLLIYNGAAGGQAADAWERENSRNYVNIVNDLAGLGYSQKQVQIAWVKVANRNPNISLSSSSSDAYRLVGQLGNITRALKKNFPNLKLVFVSSRIYAGYATTILNPEPFAYESGFAVKWLVEAQINQMKTGVIDSRTGDLNYNTGVAPWVAWGPYLWTDDNNPRSDGLVWLTSDFDFDMTHPSTAGETKVGTMMLNFFKNDVNTKRWFLNSGAAPPTFDFSLTVSPNTGTVTQGSSTTTTATVTITGSGTVTLTCTGPVGISCTFTPGTCTSTCTSMVTITTSASTPTGTQTVTITGTSGSLTKTATFTLTVNAPSSCGTTESWGFESDTASATDTESSAFMPAGWTIISTASTAGTVPDTSFGSTKALGVNGLSGEPFVKAGITRTSATLTTKVKVLAETGLDVMIAGRVVDDKNWYGIMMAPGIIQFEMQEGGGPRVAGTTSYTWALNTVYTIKLDIRPAATGGQEARAWVNNVKVIDWTNIGSVLSNGAIGFKVRNAHAHSDDVTVTDFCETTTFDFSLSNSGGITVTQGSSGSNTITATLLSGTTQSVSYTISGLPSGATASFSPSSGNPTFTSTLTITTASTTVSGTYTITVTGTSGSLTKITAFTLTVNPLTGLDITPPVVTITQPPANDIVFGSFNVTVETFDNVGVKGVEFYLDGILRKNDTVSPFDAGINASRITNTTHTIMARAYDAAGNTNTHTITVTVDEGRKIADVNSDGDVDLSDIIVMILAWGTSGITDINKDGTTNLVDIGILLSKWTG